MRDINAEMTKTLQKFGFDKFYQVNNAAFLGLLIDIKNKFESCNKNERRKLMQYYTNLGVNFFDNKKRS